MIGIMVGLVCAGAMAQGVVAPSVPAKAVEVERKPSDPQAAKLVYAAATALRQGDQDGALQQLDAAKALNPEETRLWSGYGYLHLAKGDKPTAAAEFEKELALHPEVLEVYPALADLQDDLGRRADEETTLRRMIETEPRSATAAARLVKMLQEDGKPDQALTLGKQAMTKFTDALAADPRLNPRSQDALAYELSKAYLAVGKKPESLAVMVDLLKVTQNPAILNDGAYRLADAGMELPLAEKSARTALVLAESNSRRVTLDTEPELLKQVIEQVTAVWDTVGWTLFRENKLDEAESYVRSAWLQRQGTSLGEHLVEIEAARGDKNLALTVCELSLAEAARAKPPVVDAKLTGEAKIAAEFLATEARKSGEDDKAKLRAKADELHKAGAVSKGPATLTAMLSTQIEPLRGVNGVGEFHVLLGFGIVITATPSSAKNAPGMLSRVQGAKIGVGLWPKDSGARLVMKASLQCKPTSCALVLEDLEDR